MGRTRVGVLFGGKSAEHEVSLQSARNVVEALDRERYQPLLIGVDKQGRWRVYDEANGYLEHADDPERIRLKAGGFQVALFPWDEGGRLHVIDGRGPDVEVDVFFPVLHGPLGEDGTVQGLLQLAGVPYVGSGVLGSAAAMDKEAMKRLFRDAGIPIAAFRVLRRRALETLRFDHLAGEFGLPFYLKPANMGSSVGVHRVGAEEEFQSAVEDAFRFDLKVIVEENIPGREIECSVLGNDEPQASLPGEIVPRHDFYSYEAKYVDPEGAELRVPAHLPEETAQRIQELSLRGFKALCCRGLARADFLLREDGKAFLNELNTMPGFTRISMYPKLWEASGVGYPELIHRLIQSALEYHRREAALESSYF